MELLSSKSKRIEIPIILLDDTRPEILRGTFSYELEGCKPERKLNFVMNLPCSSFLISRKISSNEIHDILRKKQLLYSHRIEIHKCGHFEDVIKEICRTFDLKLLEHTENSINLYGQSLKDHHVHILLEWDVSFPLAIKHFVLNTFLKLDILSLFRYQNL